MKATTTKSKGFKDLTVYKKAFDLAMKVFEISKYFPKEETYALTNQIRRSTRSVCSNIAESYRKRKYPAHFVVKVSDADTENSETQVWLDFALACGYMKDDKIAELEKDTIEIGRMLNHMIRYPEKYLTNDLR
jgi:four helix bundle protein